jgi:pantoate--beta-alanine ligase
MQQLSADLKAEGKIIGFVPTMGYLHKGHLSLIKKSKQKTDITIVSIFVNPTQFAPNEDLKNYPRDIERDKRLLRKYGVDYLFFPKEDEIYQKNFQTYVEVKNISKILEGEFRPTHFSGVTTIVSILFNLVKPDFAFFGQKDAQQAVIIKQMVSDLKFNIKIIICPIVRESDGLAMSSRNIYLSKKERSDALVLNKSLSEAVKNIRGGEKSSSKIEYEMLKIMNSVDSSKLDYIRIVESETFVEAKKLLKGSVYYILIACKIGNTRLIDNVLVKV